jgi:hypothetical protein
MSGRGRHWHTKRRGTPRAKEWREAAHQAITTAIAEGNQLGLTGRKLELHVSRAGCPFPTRRGYAYEVWLDAFRRRLRGYRGPMDYRARKRRRAARVSPGQAELFTP